MTQSPLFKYSESVDYLGNFPGANRERDQITVAVAAGSVDLTDRARRALGEVTVDGTPIEEALASVGADHLLVGQPDGQVWSVEQTAPVAVEDSNGTQVDPATDTTLSAIAAALASNGGDTLQVDQQGVVDVSSRDGRNLGDVDVTDLPDADYVEAAGATLASGTTNSYAPVAVGADALDGRVKASGTHDVSVEWQDSNGNVVKTNSVASGVAGGTWTDLGGLTAITPYPVVKVTDTSGADQTADVVVHLR
ncbi:putative protein 26 [Haloarcula hispanica icosahedral virus 2]|uniref:Uncharacterized protein n=1 Tax=Haloarcula hispanica icosahedral virus 2 TaxID=1154689 RepID=H9AZY2_9VIRU|nr:putative protein 26 [Haloarcula hispanica icosahedral virus 2]AFD02307.1 putative protein 26 [Haloarcula hispanica icosahedral virus 2]